MNPFEDPQLVNPQKRLKYQKDTIDQTRFADVRDRGIAQYQRELGFTIDQLAGK